jgi:hypothetical protein
LLALLAPVFARVIALSICAPIASTA